MKKVTFTLVLILHIISMFSVRKALLIGNADYKERPLMNPVNDVNDIAKVLQDFGFEVSVFSNTSKKNMRNAIDDFSNKLVTTDEVLFYYSGHGVQLAGKNYLIPIDAALNDEIDCEIDGYKADWVLQKLAIAQLTIFVLDACRDNPFNKRGGSSKGLALMQGDNKTQYIIYATESGSVAEDGKNRNSPFATAFIRNVKDSNKKIEDMMKDIKNEVRAATSNRQTPTAYGIIDVDFYFNAMSTRERYLTKEVSKPIIPITVETEYVSGNLKIESSSAGEIWLNGNKLCSITQGEIKILKNISAGINEIEFKSASGSEKKKVSIEKDKTIVLSFSRHPDLVESKQANVVALPPSNHTLIYVQGGTYQMGNTFGDGEGDEKPAHRVTLSSFLIGKYEVTQKQWHDLMGNSRSNNSNENLPIANVTWYDAIEFCNKLSIKEGLTPCYIIDKTKMDPYNKSTEDYKKWSVTCNWQANGYRLPTEAEWEYAARSKGQDIKYAWGNSSLPLINGIKQANVIDDNKKDSSDKYVDDLLRQNQAILNKFEVDMFALSLSGYGGYPIYTPSLSSQLPKSNTQSKVFAGYDDGYPNISPVGTFAANSISLYDITGNVWEWCWDWYDSSFYAKSHNTSPKGDESGTYRILRGGAYDSNPTQCRVTHRGRNHPDCRSSSFGFRLVRSAN